MKLTPLFWIRLVEVLLEVLRDLFNAPPPPPPRSTKEIP